MGNDEVWGVCLSEVERGCSGLVDIREVKVTFDLLSGMMRVRYVRRFCKYSRLEDGGL